MENTTPLTPQQYFDEIKERKNHITDAQLQSIYDNCLELLNKYKITGQKRGMQKLLFHLDCIEKEREIVAMGINTFVYKDDIEFYIGKYNLKSYGSQGQQRNAMISVKLGIADLINEIKKEAPTLLLDDVFSELDKSRQNALINCLNPNYQTIITTSSISDLDNKMLNNALLVELDRRSE